MADIIEISIDDPQVIEVTPDDSITIEGDVIQTIDLTSDETTFEIGSTEVVDFFDAGKGSGFLQDPNEGNPWYDPTAPDQVPNLTAVGGFDFVYLEYDGYGYSNHSHTEIWRATTNDRIFAVHIDNGIQGAHADSSAEHATTYYYWVRHASLAGVVGPWSSGPLEGVSATTSADPSKLLQALQDQIDGSQLTAGLNAQIAKIGSNEAAILQESIDRATAISIEAAQRAADLAAEANARAQDLADEANARTLAIAAESAARIAAIAEEAQLRANDIQRRVQVSATAPVNPVMNDYWIDSTNDNQVKQWNGTAWVDVSDARITYLLNKVEDPVTGLETLISDLDFIVNDGTTGLVQRTTTLETRLDDPSTGLLASASAIDTLETTVNHQETGVAVTSAKLTVLAATVDDIIVNPFDPDIYYSIGENFKYGGILYEVVATQTPPNVTPPNATYYLDKGAYVGLQDTVAANAGAISTLDTRVTTAEGTISTQATDITSLQTDLTTANGNISGNSSAISTLDTRMTTAEGTITTHSSDITSLQNDLTTANGNISGNSSAISGLDSRVTATEGDITSTANDVTALQAGITRGTNLLDFTAWKIGHDFALGNPVGEADGLGWARNGSAAENAIVLDIGPSGYSEPIWRCTADVNNDGDGGWNVVNIPIDHEKSYRAIVWAKQNSNAGTKYLGCSGSGTNYLVPAGGAANTNPYFWAADLPQNDKWYMIVGIIHGSGYTGADSGVAGIYDPDTGEKVVDANEFRNAVGTSYQTHRAYLYYDSTGTSVVDFARPRFEELNGIEPSIEALLAGGILKEAQANASAISTLDTRVTSAEGTITTQSSDITNLQNDLSTANGNISGNASAITALDSRVTTAEGTITSQSSDITALENTVNNETTGVAATASTVSGITSTVNTITDPGSQYRNENQDYADIQNKPLTFRVTARGYVATTHPIGGGLRDEAGTLVSGILNWYTVSVMNRATMTWDSHTGYRPSADSAAMAAALNALGSNKIVVIYTNDEPSSSRLNNGLDDAIYRCGGSQAVYGSTELFKVRGAYILIGIPGIGEGQGIELYAGDVDSSPDAWVDTTFTVHNGNVSLPGGQRKLDWGAITGANKPEDGADVTATSTAFVTLKNQIDDPSTGLGATASALDTLETAVNHGTTGLAATVTRVGSLESTVNNGTTGVAATASALDVVETLVNDGTKGNNALSIRTSTLESTINTPTTGLSAVVSTLETAMTDPDASSYALAQRTVQLETESALTRGGAVFAEYFDGPDPLGMWKHHVNNGAERWIIESVSNVGAIMRIGNNSGNDEAWLYYDTAIPYDPSRLYRVRVNIRQVSGSGNCYIGFDGLASDKTTMVNVSGSNTYGSQHFVAVSGFTPNSSFTEYVGYFSGFAATTGDANNKSDPDNPGLPHPSIRYIRPMLLANYDNQSGQFEIASWVLDIVDDLAETTRAAVQTQATSINGLEAKYTVKVDVNGHVAGYGLASEANNGAVVSTMQFAVDKFFIVSPGASQLAFAVDGGQVVMDAAFIKNASITDAKIGSLAVSKLTAGTINASVTMNALAFTGGSMNIGSGQFTVDNAGNVEAKSITIRDSGNNILLSSGGTISAAIANNRLENSVTYIPRPTGGSYTYNNGGITGAIKITLPQSWTNTMLKFEVDVYVYDGNKSFTAVVGGYNYASSSNWFNHTATIISSDPSNNHTIRFGHDGTKCCIWIGGTAAYWNFPKIVVRNFQASYSNYSVDQWDDGWSVGIVGAFDTVTDVMANPHVYANDTSNVNGVSSVTVEGNAQTGKDLTLDNGVQLHSSSLSQTIVETGVGGTIRNSDITVNPDGTLSGAGGGQINANSIQGMDGALIVAGQENYFAVDVSRNDYVADSNATLDTAWRFWRGWTGSFYLNGVSQHTKNMVRGKKYRILIRAKKAGTPAHINIGIYNGTVPGAVLFYNSDGSTASSRDLLGYGITTSYEIYDLGYYIHDFATNDNVYFWFGSTAMSAADSPDNSCWIDWIYLQPMDAEPGATKGATWGTNITNEPVSLDDINSAEFDVIASQDSNSFIAGNLVPNGNMTLVGIDGRPQGVKAVYGSATTTNISYQDAAKTILKLHSSSDTSIGAGWPAFPVNAGTQYRIMTRVKASSGVGSGFYLWLMEYDSDMPQGYTHISHNQGACEAGVIEDTRIIQLNTNIGLSTNWEVKDHVYTPTATAKWVSIVILNWDGAGTAEFHVDRMVAYPLADTTNQVIGSIPSTSFPTALQNNQITLNSNGTLSGAGGGSVSLSSLGAQAFATVSQLTTDNASTLISGAIIGSANIKTAAITTAAIADAAVNTLQLAGQSVTIPEAAYTEARTTAAVIITKTIVSTGNPVIIIAGAMVEGSMNNVGEGDYYGSSVNLILKLNGTTLQTHTVLGTGPRANNSYQHFGSGVAIFMHTPGAGTHTYTVERQYGAACSNRSIVLLEVKR